MEEIYVSILKADFKVAKNTTLMSFCTFYYNNFNNTSSNLLYCNLFFDIYQINSPYIIKKRTNIM